MHQVMTLLRAFGFDLYSSDAEHSPTRITSPLISPTLVYEMNAHELGHEFSLESGAVLTRSVDASDRPPFSQNYVSKHQAPHRPSRTKSHSPSLTDVSILSTDLACVGLCDESMDNWALKIVKLVAFPDLIPLKSRPHRPNPYFYGSNGVANIPTVKHSETVPIPDFLLRSRAGSYSTDTTLSSASDEADDGYFSHSPAGNEPPEGFLSSPASHSYPDLSQSVQPMSPSFKPTTKRVVSPSPLFSFDPKPTRGPSKSTCLQLNGSTPARQPATVPFFSFTRTSEGSSLTTDVSVLAALFPPSERHMLICAGDLDALESGSSDDSEASDEDEEETEGGTLKCLQIDLRRFGLG